MDHFLVAGIRTPTTEAGFPAGTYWLEIAVDGKLAARMVFAAQ